MGNLSHNLLVILSPKSSLVMDNLGVPLPLSSFLLHVRVSLYLLGTSFVLGTVLGKDLKTNEPQYHLLVFSRRAVVLICYSYGPWD